MKHMTSPLAILLLLALPTAAIADLAPVHVNDDVHYVSGGVGLEESSAIEEMRKDYPLSMVFAETTSNGRNQFLHGVQVEIRRDSELLLEVYTAGPYLLVHLPPGDYEVTASHRGVPKTQIIKVETKPMQVGWTWPAPKQELDPNR